MPLTILALLQEKERNAKRKKKKGAAVQNEEAAFPPAAEDEEMEVSGTSGNEEEMAEEVEGEVHGGCGREHAQLLWLCCPVMAEAPRTASLGLHVSALTRGLSPQSHTKVMVSHSTCGILDASGFHTCKECPGSLPSSRVCLDRWLFWEPFGF